MFYRLTGTLCYADATTVAVDCNGIAFQCQVSMNTWKQLADEGETVTLYTYLNVKQDGVDLFGFYHKEELETFKLLISVSGVGPKAALSILPCWIRPNWHLPLPPETQRQSNRHRALVKRWLTAWPWN